MSDNPNPKSDKINIGAHAPFAWSLDFHDGLLLFSQHDIDGRVEIALAPQQAKAIAAAFKLAYRRYYLEETTP